MSSILSALAVMQLFLCRLSDQADYDIKGDSPHISPDGKELYFMYTPWDGLAMMAGANRWGASSRQILIAIAIMGAMAESRHK